MRKTEKESPERTVEGVIERLSLLAKVDMTRRTEGDTRIQKPTKLLGPGIAGAASQKRRSVLMKDHSQ
jgi:hypothetical protein